MKVKYKFLDGKNAEEELSLSKGLRQIEWYRINGEDALRIFPEKPRKIYLTNATTITFESLGELKEFFKLINEATVKEIKDEVKRKIMDNIHEM